MILCCLPSLTSVSRQGRPQVGVKVDPLELLRFVATDFGPMNRMCERAGLSERAIYDRTKAVMEYFGFPFDSPPPGQVGAGSRIAQQILVRAPPARPRCWRYVRSALGGARALRRLGVQGQGRRMSEVSIESIKQLEGNARLAGLKRAQRSRADAGAQQTRASLVGDGRKWRITNLKEAAMVMATWR